MSAAGGSNVNFPMPRHTLWLAAILCLPHSIPALDLTPIHAFRELEGFRIPIVRFADGQRKVSYQPPDKWQVSGGGGSLLVLPPGRDQAALRFQVLPRPSNSAEQAGKPEDFERWTRGLLPPDAAEVTKESECAGQFTLGAQPSRAVIFAYTAAGQRFRASVACVDLNDKERLAVVVSARAPDFKAVQEEAIASLFSWNWSE